MTAPAPSTETNGDNEGAPATGEAALGDAGKAALAAERKAKRAAESQLAELAERLKAYEDRDKSDADKLTERASSAETRASTAESTVLRYEAAAEVGLPLNMAARLIGSTRDELVADAKQLAETLGTKAPEAPVMPAGGKPREQLKGGGDPTGGGALPLNGDPIVAALNKKLGIR